MDDVTSACHVYISFEAAEALGGMMELILSSEKVPERLKKELLDIVLHVFKALNRHQHLVPLSRVVASSLVRPYGFSQSEYREILRDYFRQADASLTVHAHVLRSALDSGGDIL